MAPPAVSSWSVGDVGAWLESLQVPHHVVEDFEENAIAGADLLTLTDEDYQELGCKPLLVR